MSADALARAAAIAPRALRPPMAGRLAGLAGLAAVVGLVVWSAAGLELSSEVFGRGLGRLGRFLSGMWPPHDGGMLARILDALAETFAMAFAGTLLAALLALPLGLLGARTIVANPVIHFALRRFLDVFRGVPALVWALILVSAFGLGPFPGVIALALADAPSLAKLYAEAIENCEERQREAVRAAGAPDLLALRYGLAPQVLPIMASQTLFYLEGNFRNAGVLGIVGAGGIGFELDERIRIFAFDQVAFIVLAYMLCVAGLDSISAALRRRLG